MYENSITSEDPLGSTKKTLIFNDSSNFKNIGSNSASFADAFLGQTPKIEKETTAKKRIFISEIGFSKNAIPEEIENKENINSSKILNKKWLKDPKARFSDVAFANERYIEKRFEHFERDQKIVRTTKNEIKNEINMSVSALQNSNKANAAILLVLIAFIYFIFPKKEEEIIEKTFFCDSQNKLHGKHEKLCIPCPDNAFCYDGKMMCLATYIEIKENKCVENTKINENADTFIKFISNFLASKCEDIDPKSYSFNEIRRILSENFEKLNYFDDSFKKLQYRLNSYEIRQVYSIGVSIMDVEGDEKQFYSTRKENSICIFKRNYLLFGLLLVFIILIAKKVFMGIINVFKKKQAQIMYEKIKSVLEEKKTININEIKFELKKNSQNENYLPLIDEIRIRDGLVTQNQEYLNGKLEFFWEKKK